MGPCFDDPNLDIPFFTCPLARWDILHFSTLRRNVAYGFFFYAWMGCGFGMGFWRQIRCIPISVGAWSPIGDVTTTMLWISRETKGSTFDTCGLGETNDANVSMHFGEILWLDQIVWAENLLCEHFDLCEDWICNLPCIFPTHDNHISASFRTDASMLPERAVFKHQICHEVGRHLSVFPGSTVKKMLDLDRKLHPWIPKITTFKGSRYRFHFPSFGVCSR